MPPGTSTLAVPNESVGEAVRPKAAGPASSTARRLVPNSRLISAAPSLRRRSADW